MLKRKFILLSMLIFMSAGVFAELTPVKQHSLAGKIYRVVASYGRRVGLTFVDLGTGWKYSVNGSEEFPAASVAKVPVMVVAYHLSNLGQLNLEQKVFFRESDKLGGSGILQWMRGGRNYTIRNLIRLMIVFSDNTATRLVINTIGRPQINRYLQEVGLAGTAVNDPTMLAEPSTPGSNLTTPDDIAHLFRMIYQGEGFSASAQKEMLYYLRNQRYRWGLWRGVAPGTVIANKTGNLDGVLNDAGIIYTKQGNYILSIFTHGFDKQKNAREIINAISQVAFEEYTGQKVIRAGKSVKAKRKVWKKRVTKRRLWRRPSAQYQRRSGHRGAASGHKSRTYRRR